MRRQWTRSDKLIAGLPAIKNKINQNKGFRELPPEYEHALVGEHGEIWESGHDMYKCVVTTPAIASRIGKLVGDNRRFTQGDEPVFTFPSYLVQDIVNLLMISPFLAISRANKFGQV